MSQTDTTTTRLSRAALEAASGSSWREFQKHFSRFEDDVAVQKRLAQDALAYMTALEKAEKDISFALGSVLTDAALLEDLREEIRKVLL